MLKRLVDAASAALLRARAYLELLAWLLSNAARHKGAALFASALAAGAAIVCQGSALALLASAVRQHAEQRETLRWDLLARLGLRDGVLSPEAAVALIVLLFLLGGVLTYLSRSSAIRIEGQLYLYYFDRILAGLTPQAGSAPGPGGRHEPLRVLLSDARYGGIVARLLLYNVIHFGNVVVGVAIVAIYAPALLALVGVFALVAALCMYPLNLRAAAASRQLEEVAPRRNRYVRWRLAQLGNVELEPEFDDEDGPLPESSARPTADEAADADTLARHVALIESRLRIIESSRIVMSVLAALAIGALLVLLFRGGEAPLVNYGVLLVLVFGLRFAMSGIEGSMVTATSINRYVPNLLRLRALLVDLERAPAPSSGQRAERAPETPAAVPSATSAPRPAAIALLGAPRVPPPAEASTSAPGYHWQLDTPFLQRAQGRLLRGHVYSLIGPSLSGAQGVAQLAELLGAEGATLLASWQRAALAQRRAAGRTDSTDLQWIEHVLAIGNLPLPRADLEAVLLRGEPAASEHLTSLACFLADCRAQRVEPLPFAVLDGQQLYKLDPPGVRAICALFDDRVVLVVSHRLRLALLNAIAPTVLLSDARRVVCAFDIPPSGATQALCEAAAAVCDRRWRGLVWPAPASRVSLSG